MFGPSRPQLSRSVRWRPWAEHRPLWTDLLRPDLPQCGLLWSVPLPFGLLQLGPQWFGPEVVRCWYRVGMCVRQCGQSRIGRHRNDPWPAGQCFQGIDRCSPWAGPSFGSGLHLQCTGLWYPHVDQCWSSASLDGLRWDQWHQEEARRPLRHRRWGLDRLVSASTMFGMLSHCEDSSPTALLVVDKEAIHGRDRWRGNAYMMNQMCQLRAARSRRPCCCVPLSQFP